MDVARIREAIPRNAVIGDLASLGERGDRPGCGGGAFDAFEGGLVDRRGARQRQHGSRRGWIAGRPPMDLMIKSEDRMDDARKVEAVPSSATWTIE